MSCRRLFQSRWFLILFALIPLLLAITHYYSKKSYSITGITSTDDEKFNEKKENIKMKIYEINDREPTYKLATYEGYEFPLERNRAQTKLINDLKLREKCQENSNTTVIDIGASLGLILNSLLKQKFLSQFSGAFGLYAAACGCQVYMFEIEPTKLFLIEQSIKLNSFQSRIHLIKKAVSDLKSNQTIYFSKNTSSQIASVEDIALNTTDFYSGKSVNLNEYNFASSDIYIFRVDVQGHELHVFRSTEKLFREHRVHHVLFEYTSWGTQLPIQKDIFDYMKQILGAKQFYALHPKEATLYGPLSDQDINQFHSQHTDQHLQRDVYALFIDGGMTISAESYNFQSSFK